MGMWIEGNRLNGYEIITSDLLRIGPFEDWSQVRSRGRAARRRRQGHKQRIRYFYKPDPKVRIDQNMMRVYVHPMTLDALRKALDTRYTPPH